MNQKSFYIAAQEKTNNVNAHRFKDILCEMVKNNYGYVTDEFYTLLNDLKAKCDKLKKETTLPDFVDTNNFNELVLKLYKEARK